MKLRGNKIPRFFVKYSHWEHRKLRCFFFSALGFGISSFLPWKKANRRIASTASEYPLADFALFRSLARTVKIACWGAGLRWRPQSVKRFEALTEPTGETPDPYKKRRLPMANRKRNIQMKFYVTEEEKRLIDEKMAQLPTRRYGAYLRKMAIDGYIIQLDTTDIKQMNAALSAIGRNINQIAKRLNAGGSAYRADVEEIRERLDEIWQLQRRILSSQR